MKNSLLTSLLVVWLITTSSVSIGASVILPNSANTSSYPLNSNPSDLVKAAMADFKNLSRSEKRSKIKDVKRAIHKYKAEKRANAETSTNTLLLVILAILIPPLAVYLHEGEINTKFWISLVLTLLFFVPGVIYALIVVLGKS